jgi:hypothetical protein
MAVKAHPIHQYSVLEARHAKVEEISENTTVEHKRDMPSRRVSQQIDGNDQPAYR